MILSNAKTAQKYRDHGLWGTVTLDGLARRWGREFPDRVALTDSNVRMTWREFDTAINAYAKHFLSQGLETDDVIAIQLDNSVAMPVILLAIMRANLIAAPLPPLWRHHDLTKALNQITPKAIVTRARIGEENHALMMCDVAMNLFSVRLIMAFGENIPDGVMDINDVEDDQAEKLTDMRPARANPADHVATMCWWSDTDPLPRPVARCHNQWISASMPTLLEAQITASDTILSAQYLTGLGAIATVLGPWLLSGAKLVLHEPFDEHDYLELCNAENATHAVIPAPISDSLQGLYSATNVKSLVCIWPDIRRARQARLDGLAKWTIPVVDVCPLAEAALYAKRRDDTHNLGQLPVGLYQLQLANGEHLDFFETRIKGGIQHAGAKAPLLGGELLVRGPMVPGDGFGPAKQRAFKADPSLANRGDLGAGAVDGFVATGITCAISGTNPPMIEPVTSDLTVAMVGGLGVSLTDIDQCFSKIESIQEAAAFCVKDKLLGHRIYGAYVPQPGQVLSVADIQMRLRQDGIASYKIPEKFIEVAAIPRHDDGSPNRDLLQDEI
ncbi:MAG: acyl--CoA ligase [Fimbriimonadaceae bacterium]|nr:acyl--CoA ligase [Alphaproteobacteria bacterium]